MFRCKVCGNHYSTKRAIHGHLVGKHRNEYADVGRCDEELYDVVPDIEGTKPVGFRLLNLKNDEERSAYEGGYMFIDAEEYVYTVDDAKENGWI